MSDLLLDRLRHRGGRVLHHEADRSGNQCLHGPVRRERARQGRREAHDRRPRQQRAVRHVLLCPDSAASPCSSSAAAVRSGTDLVGALVTEVPVRALTDVMTAQGDWQRLGLGASGESYIVGGDRTLRTDTRAWLEDPADYLRRHLAAIRRPWRHRPHRAHRLASPCATGRQRCGDRKS